MDADVLAFRTVSGATDVTIANQLAKYLKAQSLWPSCRFFPFKAAQNKGSGTTVYGLGGWTSNDVTLVNGPVWGANGVAFDAVDDRGTWDGTGIATLSELYSFDVQIPTGASLADTARYGVLSVGSNGANTIVYMNIVASAIYQETIAFGVTANADVRRAGSSTPSWSAGDRTQIISRLAQTGSAMWKSKSAATLDKKSGTQDFRPSQSGWTSGSILNINCSDNGGGNYANFVATTRVALLFCKTSLTQSQRETITDYLDAL